MNYTARPGWRLGWRPPAGLAPADWLAPAALYLGLAGWRKARQLSFGVITHE